ncbi:hypothetical protein HYV43_03290 [Candidatus Micrarchaeota archaeon]|nr:hypothetical protein [Candidatus Micrarchaeota archaeon]
MEPISKTPKEAYVEGRLVGLNELVSLLKDALDEQGDHRDGITKSIVQHIYSETNSILDDVHGQHPVAVANVLQKQQDTLETTSKKALSTMERKTPEEAAPQVRKSVDAADELMKKLMALREQEAAAK